jgi:hypothetical protein
VTVIVGGRYVERIIEAIPETWGVIQAAPGSTSVELNPVREPTRNECVDPLSVTQLLWRDEALALLEERELARGLRSKPRRLLWQAIVDQLSPEEVGEAVRAQLKAREGWRSDPRPTQDGGSRQPVAT